MTRKFLLLFLLLCSFSVQAYIDEPVVVPENPTSADVIRLDIVVGVCNAIASDLYHGHTIDENLINLVVTFIDQNDPVFCMYPDYTYSYELGRLPPGDYTLDLIKRDSTGSPMYPDELAHTISFSVGQGYHSIPTSSPVSITVLIISIMLLTSLLTRKGFK